ncbi:unnamed protein product [Arctogadus glacialis]
MQVFCYQRGIDMSRHFLQFHSWILCDDTPFAGSEHLSGQEDVEGYESVPSTAIQQTIQGLRCPVISSVAAFIPAMLPPVTTLWSPCSHCDTAANQMWSVVNEQPLTSESSRLGPSVTAYSDWGGEWLQRACGIPRTEQPRTLNAGNLFLLDVDAVPGRPYRSRAGAGERRSEAGVQSQAK